jgi:hypothetical protein
MYSRAAPPPIADRSRAVAFFESGDLVAVSLKDGKKLWSRDLKEELGPLSSRHGLGSSLAQTDKLLFINLEHDGPSALLAIQKSDGVTKWKSGRPSGSSWSSPAVMQRGDQTQVVVSSGGEAAGYDATTGKELWKVADLAGNSVPSPLVVGNRIYLGARLPEFGSVSSAAKSNLCLEFAEGAVEPKVAWRSERCVTDYASPVVCGDNVFLINGDGILGCLDKNTGQEKYRQRLGMVCWATPIVHGNHLFVFGKNGKTTVLKADGEFSKVGDNRLWDPADPPRPASYVEYFPSSGGSGHGHGGHGNHGVDGQKHGESHATHAGGAKQPDESKAHSHGGGHSGHETSSGHGDGKNPAAGMLAGMLKRDADGDGLLSGEEIPGRLKSVMENIDLNKDGSLDKTELKKMADSFAAKRKGSKQSSRDPIVYGVAADANGIIVRTGTRLEAARVMNSSFLGRGNRTKTRRRFLFGFAAVVFVIGCGQPTAPVVIPFSIPEEFSDGKSSWEHVAGEPTPADNQLIGMFFEKNADLIGSPDWTGKPEKYICTTARSRRRFYWFSGNSENPSWNAIEFSGSTIQQLSGIGAPGIEVME